METISTINRRQAMKHWLWALLVMLAFTDCTDKPSGPKMIGRRVTVADSLVWYANDNKDFPRMLALCDSFENTGDFSAIRANFYRGNVFLYNLGKREEALECYRLATANGLKDYGDLWCYQEAAGNYIRMMFIKQDYEGLVREAVPILTVLDSVETEDPEARLRIHSILGQSNMRLKQSAFAKENFACALSGFRKWIPQDTTGRAAFIAIEDYDNIAGCYLDEKQYDEAEVWLARADSLLPALKAYAETWNKIHIYDDRNGVIAFQHIIITQAQGREAEAAKLYEEFKKLPFAATDYGRLYASEYLVKAHRYQEAADQMTVLDRMFLQTGAVITMDNIPAFIQKLKANIGAGRKDSVMYVASQIVEHFDSALVRQKEMDAAKIATIYDTQGKERQIAQQKAELLQQRVIGLIVAIVLLTIFFIIYTLLRRRHAQRMAEMKAAQERIESELSIARNIQMSMVPSQFPDRTDLDMYASMTPAKEVGGDLYGYVLIGDRLYFAVGDVSGKGVPASLFMAQATRLFRTLAAQQMMPAEICTRINDALSGEDNQSNMFVTLWLGLIDLTTGHLDYCNAAHNPPIFCNNTSDGNVGNCQFLDMIPNMPIGVFPGFEYKGEEIDNIHDCLLFIYTDGLNEAENRQHQQFGDERLIDILRTCHFDSAQQVVDTLKAEIDHHRDGAEPNDDLTMMCVRI